MPFLHPLPIGRLAPLVCKEQCCVVLDCARPSREQRYSLLFLRPRSIIRCSKFNEVRPTLEAVSGEARRFWVAGYCAYEAGYALEERLARIGEQRKMPRDDLLWFGVFDKPYRFDHLTGEWDRPLPIQQGRRQRRGEHGNHEISPGKPDLAMRRTYEKAVRAIQKKIAAGDVYQVNYTFPFHLSSSLPPWDLYVELRKRQPVAFGAFIKTRQTAIVSLSPELFFMQKGPNITVRPMKGTAPRGRYGAEDRAIATALACDPKNRSENVMIVDLLRNDLGRVCCTGSIKVDRLFEVERHPTLHQMTSTVSGRLQRGVGLVDIIQALFPSGSVTGAPKIRAMEIIRNLEPAPRGVYCGAIGYSSPSGRSVFSVPIRTLSRKNGRAGWRYGVGSGIVADSVPRDEWVECAVKCKFLTKSTEAFRLFESMLFERGAVRYGREHYLRMKSATEYYGIPFIKTSWDAVVAGITRELGASTNRSKVRIYLDQSGSLFWDHIALRNSGPGEPAMVLLSKRPVHAGTSFLFHKTTVRPWYEAAMRLIRRGACFDVIHQNEDGQLTEGARTNLFVKIAGTLYTPPVESGLLPGVLRGRLLGAKKCREQVLYPGDLKRAEAVFCGNSVRGMMRVALVER